MLEEKNRKIIAIMFIVGVVFILATITACWNAFIMDKDKLGVLPLLYAVLAIASISYLFRLAYKISDIENFNNYVEQKIAESRAKLIEEIKIEEENKKKDNIKVDDIPEKAKALIPIGKFKNIESFGKKLLVSLANGFNLVQGIMYIVNNDTDEFYFTVGYALPEGIKPASFKTGENLNGETAKSQELMIINDIPENYFTVESGLGESQPKHLFIIPIVADKKTIAVIEMASFAGLSEKKIRILDQAREIISTKISLILKA
jgi:hypothetical protein